MGFNPFAELGVTHMPLGRRFTCSVNPHERPKLNKIDPLP
ncbi:MAG: hypothetical protein ACI89E_001061 [Planctomycetota bacterium]